MTVMTIREQPASPGPLLVEMTAADPVVVRLLTEINRLDAFDPARYEAEATLFMALACASWRECDRLISANEQTG